MSCFRCGRELILFSGCYRVNSCCFYRLSIMGSNLRDVRRCAQAVPPVWYRLSITKRSSAYRRATLDLVNKISSMIADRGVHSSRPLPHKSISMHHSNQSGLLPLHCRFQHILIQKVPTEIVNMKQLCIVRNPGRVCTNHVLCIFHVLGRSFCIRL